ncbi:MAG TPA: chromosomal replication initiator protein DnaA, partial [Thermoanaerobaculia bacterium]|nr:chromosomal replication initiator protein DnaA [Thermoanaerobaculia bacterium]
MSKNLWKDLQRELERQLDPDEFATWFRPLRVQREDAERLVLVAPNDHFLHALEQSYRPAVDRAIAGLRGPAFRVLFSLDEKPGSAPDRQAPQLNARYLFDNFVVGSSNQFAHAAARAVAESPAHSYNPLFLYGGVGLGKTHLLHAIGHEIQQRHGNLRVLYLAAEQFVNELINSIRFDRMPAFRDRYRTIDVLLIDDIQFIANKERTQEEFFHTFNTLYTAQKQIILSSDAPPRSIPALEERLRSRFEWGLIADIQPPELETKIVILRRKGEALGQLLPDDVALFLAQQVRSNVRELEGLLNRVLAFSALTGRSLSLELAKETLRDILPEADRRVSAGDVIKFVARHYGLKVSEIKSKSNQKQIAFPRQVAMWMCKRLTELSYPDIGRQFND